MEKIPEPVSEESVFKKVRIYVLLFLVGIILSLLMALLFVNLGIMNYTFYLFTVSLLIVVICFAFIVVYEKVI